MAKKSILRLQQKDENIRAHGRQPTNNASRESRESLSTQKGKASVAANSTKQGEAKAAKPSQDPTTTTMKLQASSLRTG